MFSATQQPPSYNDATTDGQQQGYSQKYPPQGQYPPQQGQYPPQQGQYPPQQGQYSQQYPAGQVGYPPQYTPYGHPGYTNVVVSQPPPAMAVTGPPPQDHMCAAVFVTLCCFWPTGIIAIIKAMDARNALERGDLMTAQNSARSAKQMVTISVIVGIISIIVVGILVGVYVGVILAQINDSNSYYD
ncbi:hypothetical protein SNE40_002023 [Patella caerulea]|uniref:Proline-rich transmembrane protein 1-like n=1 Tax=Patella caerulea TaxID=87958 RepID=A0AAN8K0C7_PATCE